MSYVQKQLEAWQEAEKMILGFLGRVVKRWFGFLYREPERLQSPLPAFQLQHALAFAMPLAALPSAELAKQEFQLYGSAESHLQTLARYYGQHSPVIAQKATDDIQAKLRILVFKAMQDGASEKEAVQMMQAAGLPFAAHRLRTIARTELTNASTLARLGLFAENGHSLFRYSNVLDDRTTDTCRAATGLILDLLRELDREIVPANHYLCRSMISPVVQKGVKRSPLERIENVIQIRSHEFPGWQSRLASFVGELYAS